VWKQEFFPARVDVDPLNMKEAGPIFTEWMSDKDNVVELTNACHAALQEYEGDLKGFEKVRSVYVEPTMSDLGIAFTQKNNLLTPSMKLVRPRLKIHYLDQLKDMYTKLGMASHEDEEWM